jgi:hypothetical protein
MTAYYTPAAPALVDEIAAVLACLPRYLADVVWAFVLRLLHHPVVPGRHAASVERPPARPESGVDDTFVASLHSWNNPDPDDTQPWPFVDDSLNSLLTHRPPSPVDVAFAAGTRVTT